MQEANANATVFRFLKEVNALQSGEQLVVSGNLTGRTTKKQEASSMIDINSFVKNIITNEKELNKKDLADLRQAYTKVCASKIHWYHKIAALFSKKYTTMLKDAAAIPKAVEQKMAINIINDAVNTHLISYLTGAIQPHSTKDRKPLIEALRLELQKMTPDHGLSDMEIETIACKTYLKISIAALSKALKRHIDPRGPESEQDRLFFINKFAEAAKIDFTPGFLSDTERVASMIEEALYYDAFAKRR